ncbi:MAG: DUF255 domain-containing protein, partial [Chromatiales bacterium]
MKFSIFSDGVGTSVPLRVREKNAGRSVKPMKAGHCRVSLLLLLLVLFPQAVFPNALRDHLSPYLAMHGNDPVDWRDWGEAALDEAQESGKLLFISSGYFSCHWCHVMQQESYQDDEIAA